MSARTPGPWRTDEHIGHFGRNRVWSADKPVASVISQGMAPPDIDPEAQANAAFIVLACNSHADLLAALRDCRSCMDSLRDFVSEGGSRSMIGAREAIAESDRLMESTDALAKVAA